MHEEFTHNIPCCVYTFSSSWICWLPLSLFFGSCLCCRCIVCDKSYWMRMRNAIQIVNASKWKKATGLLSKNKNRSQALLFCLFLFPLYCCAFSCMRNSKVHTRKDWNLSNTTKSKAFNNNSLRTLARSVQAACKRFATARQMDENAIMFEKRFVSNAMDDVLYISNGFLLRIPLNAFVFLAVCVDASFLCLSIDLCELKAHKGLVSAAAKLKYVHAHSCKRLMRKFWVKRIIFIRRELSPNHRHGNLV